MTTDDKLETLRKQINRLRDKQTRRNRRINRLSQEVFDVARELALKRAEYKRLKGLN